MDNNPFQIRTPNIAGNPQIRAPQQEAFSHLVDFASDPSARDREVGIVLPVGCGKSGCIALAPFAFKSTRTLVVAPNVKIAEQLSRDVDPAHSSLFYDKYKVLKGQPFPEPVQIQGTTVNIADLEAAHIVITNIQQLQRTGNPWLQKLPAEFFDLILFDEGHHNVAQSWDTLRKTFSSARIVNFSATPLRADGQPMAGRILYSYPVRKAIQAGYVKRLKALVLNPRTLRYIRREDEQEVEVDLDEVRRLGEQDAGFRRSIVTSHETLTTIVDASIRELDRLRDFTDEKRLKIIASALNFEHCRQIVEEYRARGRKADYLHSKESNEANKRVMRRLEANDLDVIVQVRKLGEGFDHPYLAVAAIFSIFSNLSPFVQFVGRTMRVIKQNAPNASVNWGTVVFHAGANVARRWTDFQEFSEADQEYFDQLLPMECLDFESGDELVIRPEVHEPAATNDFDVLSQTEVHLQELPLIQDDPEVLTALQLLRQKGYTSQDVTKAYGKLEPVPVTKVRRRQAGRKSLDTRVRTEVKAELAKRDIKPEGMKLDRKRLGWSNFVVLKSAVDRAINAAVGRSSKERHSFTQADLDQIDRDFPAILERAVQEVFNA